MTIKQAINEENAQLNHSTERLFAREELVYNVTEDLLVILENANISKKELARRLGKSRSYVTQILSGARNMTLGSLSDICFALGFKPEIKLPVQPETTIVTQPTSTNINAKPQANIQWQKQDRPAQQSNRQTTNVIDRRNPSHWEKAA